MESIEAIRIEVSGGDVLLAPWHRIAWRDGWGGEHRCAAGKLGTSRDGAGGLSSERCGVFEVRTTPGEPWRSYRSIEEVKVAIPFWLSFAS
jgi:hypothetical protein